MKKLVLVIGLLAIAGSAYATPAVLNFVAFQPGGWQVGYPYFVTVDGNLKNLMCDDWEHGGAPGDLWEANLTNLGTGDLTLLRFNGAPGALSLYDQAGWLLLQTRVTPQSQWTDINFAVWKLFDASVPLTPGSQNWLDLAQNEAAAGFPGVDFSQVGIYTPLNQHDPNPENPQEFLTIVPEPSTFVLLGTGFAGWLARKRRTY